MTIDNKTRSIIHETIRLTQKVYEGAWKGRTDEDDFTALENVIAGVGGVKDYNRLELLGISGGEFDTVKKHLR